jgi:ADP-heptose:LPS heptosyltransferase
VLQSRGARVIFGCRPELGRLFSGLAGCSQVVTAGQTLPAFDLHCPLLSLPLFCGTTLSNLPADVPYIRVADDIAGRWKNRLGPSGRPKVGLCWAGSPRNRNDRFRSIPIEKFLPLARSGEIEFHSLQVGPAAGDQARVPALSLKEHGHDLGDFAETAGLIDQLDLVISVDTAVAHLAGALGKPVWILLPALTSDWRWLMDRTDSPWYPTTRIFRQRRDWEEVIASVLISLREMFASRGARSVHSLTTSLND